MTTEFKGPADIVTLGCACRLLAASGRYEQGQPAACPRRHGDSRVVKVEAEFRVKCSSCSHSKGFGAARLTASLYAVEHGKRLRHTTEVRQGDAIRETYRYAGNTRDLLAEGLDIPPY